MKNLKIISSIGTISLPFVTVISCGGGNSTSDLYNGIKTYSGSISKVEFKNQNNTFDIERDLDPKNLYDATIDHWIDGDTPTVIFKNKILDKTKWNIRISSIDTPELHTKNESTGAINVETTGDEFVWGSKAKELGKKLMPAGTKIKIYTTKSQSYNRIVGSLFYKNPSETKYHSYAVDVLREGLAMPFFNDKVDNVTESYKAGNGSDPTTYASIIGETGIAMADAYNDAVKNLRGIFSLDTAKVVGIHGTTDDSRIRYRTRKLENWDELNIYEIYTGEY